MTVSAATLKKLMDAGIAGDALLDIVASIEADQAIATADVEATKLARALNADRQKRWRDRRRNVTNNVTDNVTGDVTNNVTPLPDKEKSPLHPSKEINPSPEVDAPDGASVPSTPHASTNDAPPEKPKRPRKPKPKPTLGDMTEALDTPRGSPVAPAKHPDLPEDGPLWKAVKLWNERAHANGWSAALGWNEKRKTNLEMRLAEVGGIGGWITVLNKCEQSDFLMGRSAKNAAHPHWRFKFDNVIDATMFLKIIEGFYEDDKNRVVALNQRGGFGTVLARIREHRRRQNDEAPGEAAAATIEGAADPDGG